MDLHHLYHMQVIITGLLHKLSIRIFCFSLKDTPWETPSINNVRRAQVNRNRLSLPNEMRLFVLASLGFCLLAAVSSQNVGTQAVEEPLNLPISVCTAPGSCTTEADAVVLDSNWRWTHTVITCL